MLCHPPPTPRLFHQSGGRHLQTTVPAQFGHHGRAWLFQSLLEKPAWLLSLARLSVRVLLVGIKEGFEGLVHHVGCAGSTGLVGLVVSESPVVLHRNRRRKGALLLFLVFFFHWFCWLGFLLLGVTVLVDNKSFLAAGLC